MMGNRVLIVEDDQSIADLQKDYLQLSGFEVDVLLNGDNIEAYISEHQYELVILDIMLPGRDGFELLEVIRQIKQMPILLVSARSEDIYKIKGLGLGADDYITKPFSPAELVARVQAHINKYKRLEQLFKTDNQTEDELLVNSKRHIINVRGLVIYTDSRQVFIGEREVILANKEYDLLLYLVQHANRVFSKEELFDKIWGLEAFGDVSTVTVHIARIREKIEKTPSKPEYIVTVWGAGYRFKL